MLIVRHFSSDMYLQDFPDMRSIKEQLRDAPHFLCSLEKRFIFEASQSGRSARGGRSQRTAISYSKKESVGKVNVQESEEKKAGTTDVPLGWSESALMIHTDFFSLEKDGQLQGFCISERLKEQSAHIQDFWISPEVRGKGLGTAFFQKVVALTHNKYFCCFPLEGKNRGGAYKFWQKLGFRSPKGKEAAANGISNLGGYIILDRVDQPLAWREGGKKRGRSRTSSFSKSSRAPAGGAFWKLGKNMEVIDPLPGLAPPPVAIAPPVGAKEPKCAVGEVEIPEVVEKKVEEVSKPLASRRPMRSCRKAPESKVAPLEQPQRKPLSFKVAPRPPPSAEEPSKSEVVVEKKAEIPKRTRRGPKAIEESKRQVCAALVSLASKNEGGKRPRVASTADRTVSRNGARKRTASDTQVVEEVKRKRSRTGSEMHQEALEALRGASMQPHLVRRRLGSRKGFSSAVFGKSTDAMTPVEVPRPAQGRKRGMTMSSSTASELPSSQSTLTKSDSFEGKKSIARPQAVGFPRTDEDEIELDMDMEYLSALEDMEVEMDLDFEELSGDETPPPAMLEGDFLPVC